MRRLLVLVEHALRGTFMLHVSPLTNLVSIQKQGLVPNAEGGNYSGYHSSLPGVYVTSNPAVLHQHIAVRDMADAYLLAVVLVEGEALADEDALDGVLQRAYEASGGGRDDDMAADEDAFDAERIAQAMAPMLRADLRLGSDVDDDFLIEFCETWIRDWLWGEGGVEIDWWIEAKDRLVRASRLASPSEETFSVRLPGSVGFEGSNRIVALVAVRNGVPNVVYGEIPPAARNLVAGVT